MSGLMAFGQQAIFTVSPERGSDSLWKSDGTSAGTVLLRDGLASWPGWLSRSVVLGGRLVFSAGANPSIWSTDGTPGGTYQLIASGWPMASSAV